MNDIISRQATLEHVQRLDHLATLPDGDVVVRLSEVEDAIINGLPPMKPQRETGHWIEIQAPDSDGNALYECSICHSGETHTPVVEVPFCWHCGAQMEGQG